MDTLAQDAAPLRRTSPFSYRCHACSRCCRGYRIKVDPYEVLLLARHLAISTTALLQRYVGEDGIALKHNSDDSCVFLSDRGCTVHPARPLACRLYPLGRRAESTGSETFYHLTPHPQTEGHYGTDGTVHDYLTDQKTQPLIDGAERYLVLFRRLVAALGSMPDKGVADSATFSEWLDPDAVINRQWPGQYDSSLSPDETMTLHIRALEAHLLPAERESA